MPKKVKKKPNIKKKLEQECHDLWSLCVRTRDRTCRICGSDEHLSGHHIFTSKMHSVTRYDIENGMALCWYNCHCRQKFNPEWFFNAVRDVIGEKEYQRLKVKSQPVWKWTVTLLEAEKVRLTKLLKRLEREYGKL